MNHGGSHLFYIDTETRDGNGSKLRFRIYLEKVGD